MKDHVKNCSKCLSFNKNGVHKAPLCEPEAVVERFEKCQFVKSS